MIDWKDSSPKWVQPTGRRKFKKCRTNTKKKNDRSYYDKEDENDSIQQQQTNKQSP